jgi:hypothetical protein
MSQLNFYVPDDIEEQIKYAAKQEGKSVSAFLSELVKSKLPQKKWNKDFFESTVGQWVGDFPEIERQLPQEREEF